MVLAHPPSSPPPPATGCLKPSGRNRVTPRAPFFFIQSPPKLHPAVRDPDRARGFALEPGVITGRLGEVVDDPGVDLVVELMGGKESALEAVRRALEAGKPVVTANKELIAAHGPELLEAAESSGVPLLFEAAVGGGIPIIRPLSETLAGEPVRRVLGIVNGTTNFILTRMTEEGTDFAAALADTGLELSAWFTDSENLFASALVRPVAEHSSP